MTVMHILNGTAFLPTWTEAGLEGEAFCWADLLMEGPLSREVDGPPLRRMRAAWLERALGVPQDRYLEGLAAQTECLGRCQGADEVVLWFEGDLFCQVHLLYLVARFAAPDLAGVRLSLCYDLRPGGLGQVDSEGAANLHAARVEVDAAARAAGHAAWYAYAGPQPGEVAALLDGGLWEPARTSLANHLLRFPGEGTGICVAEEAVLRAADQGPVGPHGAFAAIRDGDLSGRLGLGDLQAWLLISRMAEGASPLLAIEGPGPLPRFGEAHNDWNTWSVSLAPAGEACLAGAHDAAANPAWERWLGGARLVGPAPAWRRRGDRIVSS